MILSYVTLVILLYYLKLKMVIICIIQEFYKENEKKKYILGEY